MAVKKIVGAKRTHIILQIFTETFVSVFIAVLSAVLLATFFLPYLNTITNRNLPASSLYQLPVIGWYVLIIIVTTLLAGAYPAVLISSLKVNQVLKTKVLAWGSRTTLRNILVTGQFTLAIIFIVSLIVFLKQLHFLQNKDLGYSYNQVINIPMDVQSAAKLPVLRSELLKIKGVTDVTNGFMELGGNGSLFGIDYVAPNGEKKHVSVNFENGAPNYTSFFGIKLIAGHSFSKDNPANEYLINETLARQIGYSDPVGKQINLTSFPPGIIAGVVKDFNYSSLHTAIEPLLISSIDYIPVWKSQLYIKVATAAIPNTIKQIQAVVKNISGDADIQFKFLDEHFKEVYQSERQAGIMIAVIGGLAIVIACLGLFSLAAFLILRRTKEIGIRKILGASIITIIGSLSREFVKLVITAFIIASPVAWYVMNKWLQDYAYRIQISWWMFALAGLATVLSALITVSFQSIKAAIANPVKSLRTE